MSCKAVPIVLTILATGLPAGLRGGQKGDISPSGSSAFEIDVDATSNMVGRRYE